MEKFKNIIGYSRRYKISNTGKVFNSKRNTFLKIGFDRDGYCRVTLSKNSKPKTFYIHRLIAIYFIPNPNNYSDVHHINEIKTDNRVENLMWIDKIEHCKISPKAIGIRSGNGVLTDKQVLEIRKMYIPYKVSCKEISEIYNVSLFTINRIIRKLTYKHL